MRHEIKYIVEVGKGRTFIWQKTHTNVFSVVGKTVGEMDDGNYTQCYEGQVPETLKEFGYNIIVQASDNIEVEA